MSKIPKRQNPLNDGDIAALFESEHREPSAELDKRVLDNARSSQNAVHKPGQQSVFLKYSPVFGTAAVVVLAVILAPFIVSSPESSLQQPEQSTNDSIVATSNADLSADLNHSQTQVVPSPAATKIVSKEVIGAEAVKTEQSLGNLNSVAKSTTEHAESPAQDSVTALSRLSQSEAEPSADPVDKSTATTALADQVGLYNLDETSVRQAEEQSIAADSDTGQSNRPAVAPPSLVATADQDNEKRKADSQISKSKTNALEAEHEAAVERSESTAARAANISGDTNTVTENDQQADTNKRDILPSRNRSVEYRETATLWIKEIKRLHNDNDTRMALTELKAFRERYPDNINERLLPEDLKSQLTE